MTASASGEDPFGERDTVALHLGGLEQRIICLKVAPGFQGSGETENQFRIKTGTPVNNSAQ